MSDRTLLSPPPQVSTAPLSGEAMDRVVRIPAGARWKRIALVATAACGVAGALAWATPRGLPVQRAELALATVTAGTFDDDLVVRATVVPAHSVLLDATDGGRVDAVFASDGASVRSGELLYRLSNPQREEEVLARSADVAQQLANLSVQRAALAGARAAQRRDLASLAFERERADAETERTRRLAAAGFLSAAALEDTQRRSTLERTLVDEAREDGEAEMRTREQSVRELERAVGGLQEGLRLMRAAADGLAARAPRDGRLAGFALEVGATVHPGDHLGRIDEDGGYKLVAAVDEFYRERLRPGQDAALDSGAPGGAHAALRVARIEPQISNGRVGIDLVFADVTPPSMQAGQGVDVRLVLGRAHAALLLDDGQFYADSGGAWAYVLDADGDAARRRDVTLGRRSAGRVEVLGGLHAGERVIVSGVRRFGDAQRLRLTN